MNSRMRRFREAARYLGYGRIVPDDAVQQMIEDCFRELEMQTEWKAIYEVYDLKIEGSRITIGPFEVASRNLAKNLKGCEKIVVFAATLGAAADRAIRKYERIQISKAVVMQACAAAKLEEYCDSIQNELAKEAAEKGYYLRPRFSPGYGDFPIQFQKELLELLDAQRKIGLTLTDASMLVPVKSVTAVIGAGHEKTGCVREGCECCEKEDCIYRRDTIEEGET